MTILLMISAICLQMTEGRLFNGDMTMAAIRCERCRQSIRPGKSFFVVKLFNDQGKPGCDVVKTATLGTGDTVVHVNGDLDCGREVSGFRKNLARAIGVDGSNDFKFLDLT